MGLSRKVDALPPARAFGGRTYAALSRVRVAIVVGDYVFPLLTRVRGLGAQPGSIDVPVETVSPP